MSPKTEDIERELHEHRPDLIEMIGRVLEGQNRLTREVEQLQFRLVGDEHSPGALMRLKDHDCRLSALESVWLKISGGMAALVVASQAVAHWWSKK